MKKIAVATLLCTGLAVLFYTCKKSSTSDGSDTTGLHKPKTGSLALATVTDDTQSLQSLINAGNVTLTAGKTYHVTGLKVTHSINMNGATIVLTKTATYTFALTVS